MIIVTDNTFKTEVEEAEQLVVIDFYADWCGPCRMLAPTMTELEGEYPDVKFCKVNVDDCPELAKAFKIQSIPFVAFVKDNTFLDMTVGLVPKEKIAKLIDQYK